MGAKLPVVPERLEASVPAGSPGTLDSCAGTTLTLGDVSRPGESDPSGLALGRLPPAREDLLGVPTTVPSSLMWLPGSTVDSGN